MVCTTGTAKQGKTDKAAGIWHWGVRYYASADLYNWEDRGLLIPPVTDDPNSSLHPTSMMDRPHIIYNARTQKYVCWLKIMEKDQTQTETVLTADSFFGPYTIVREKLRPLGMSAGDFDLAVAPDGKAYYFFERVHSETIIADLTEDYTDVTGYYSTHFPHKGPPHVREATAHFIRHGKHYLLTSGTTGYFPNPSEAAMADTWHGPYTVQGDPHIGDKTKRAFTARFRRYSKCRTKRTCTLPVPTAGCRMHRITTTRIMVRFTTDSLIRTWRKRLRIGRCLPICRKRIRAMPTTFGSPSFLTAIL